MVPILSVAVVSFNTRDLLRQCLLSLHGNPAHRLLPWRDDGACEAGDTAAQGFMPSAPIPMEVAVVDNGSDDGSGEMVAKEFPVVRLTASETNLGFARATNLAFGQSHGAFLLLLNPDAVVHGDALLEMASFLALHPRVAAVAPRLEYPDGRYQANAFRFPTLAMVFLDFFPLHHRLANSRLNGRYPRTDRPTPIDHPLGACLMVRQQAIEDVGPLDEGFFMYCEEVDWCLRARRRGWEIYHLPEAVVVHHSARSTSQRPHDMMVALHVSRARLYRKHYPRWFRVAARAITSAGLWSLERRVRRAAARGELDQEQVVASLEALHRLHRELPGLADA